MKPIFRSLFGWAPCLVLVAAVSLAQSPSDFEAQLRAGDAALQAGRADAALSAGDAAVRLAPDRWDGYALSGRALLALKRYESAADALSKAIDRAPEGEQTELRDLRRQCLLEEAGVTPGAPAAAVAGGGAAPAPSAPVASAPVPPAAPAVQAAAPAAPAAPVPPAAPAVQAAASPAPPATPARVARRKRKSKAPLLLFDPNSPEAAWTDSTGLIWARPWYYPAKDLGPFDFPQAQAVCAGLELLGEHDWRLPTVQEVQRIYQVSSKMFRFSPPKFDPDYGLNEAMKHDAWRVPDFTVGGDTFDGNRVLIWSSTPGDQPGRHEAVYFGRAYSVDDDQKVGSSLHGTHRRSPFHAYALCVRDGGDDASR